MEGHHYTDENGYGYSYDPNQMYYIDPNMQQADFYQQGQQYGTWQWQPQGYQPVQQAMYGGYPQQGMNYNYYNQYDNGFVYNQQQGLVNYDGQTAYGRQSVSSRSKHSYSQNRSKNRQRPEVRHNISSYDTENSNNNAMEANIVSHKETDSDEVSGVNLINKESSTENSNDATDFKGQDKSRNRGGRFQGTDSRTKKFDSRQQALDRQKGYDRNQRYDKGDRNNSSVNDWDVAKDEGKLSEDTESGARPKSYRDSRNNFDNRRDRYSEKDRKNVQEGGRNGSKSYGTDKSHSDSKNNESNDKVSKDFGESDRNDASSPVNDASGKSDGNGKDRKKKKEYQVYSSSNSPREWQMKPNQSNSPRNAYDRYNYRGQDYNKRHKEYNSQAIERGGDRTKLTVEVTGDGSENQDQETASKDDDDSAGDIQGSKNVRDAQRKSKNNGPQRGSRFKQKGKVDESQRGTLIEQLSKGSYECMVCCESVRASNAVWSCSNCYHVFHLRCIKKWAKSPNAVVSGTEKDGWRCPACQNLSFKFPNQYRCFCGKVRDPEVSRMDTPHSCGDVCQKDRGEGCKHPCNILCHPGPCPDCNATITKSCDCGKTKQSAKCSQSTVIKCELVCERMLNCGRHFCQAKCHSGPCDKCEKVIVQECYGEHENREVVCGSEESFTESYSCKCICSKKLDCGNHECEKPCHIHACDSCTLLPKNTSHCPCGAKKLTDLSPEPRVSCLDPVPTCGAVCNKVLDCGPAGSPHRCERTCHEGPCGPCNGTTLLSCQCLFMDKEFKCSEIAKMTEKDHKFLCDKRCNRKKSCGRHKCGQPCCIREEHPCDLVCGRKLPCGLHKCTEPCHKNNCPPCLMAGFDELTCHCGAEVLYPPIPCGTNPPECFKPCTRQHSCDHTVRHNCHSEEKCPPCTELTKKMCMGNHVTRANIPCHLTDISCGMKCSKPLPCGEHSCIRTCHKGPCLEEDQVCQQPCQKKRDLCDHICGAMCHGDTPCPKTACKAKVILKCVCGHKESETLCSTGGISPDSDYQKLAMQSLKDSIQGIMGASSSVNISKLNQIKQGQARVLECNEECAVIERNRRIALALEIQNPDLSSKLGSPSYTDFLKEQAKKDPVFVAGIEKAFADLVQSAKQSKQPSRSHAFPSMNMNQRKLVHELAEFYGCQTQSYDYEPKKNVVATAPRDKCWLPSVTLTALVQRELHPRAPPPIPHLFKEDTLRMTNLATKQSTSVLGGEPSSSSSTPEGWQVIGKKTKKTSSNSASTSKSAISTIDKFESDLEDICSTGTINYDSLSKESKQALKSEPVVDYFDFTVN
ncbi:transcriptional repressor NF-X1-like isoform X2 [Ruditapes philippinarum]|nr:transcriptional repressor NF-X1-like isoform X2 [Ruditapes philippinarum]